MKLLICFGTRPEAIKMAPIIHELKSYGMEFTIVITAQHREMLDQVLEFFEILPDYDLDLMKPNQTLNELSGRILSQFDEVLEIEKPELVIVQGDTTTAFIIALASFHRGIKVGHVEAGLRTYNKQAPFPEEANRQMISKLADLHFAPTAQARLNLLKDQIDEKFIYTTGNTVVDALLMAIDKIKRSSRSDEVHNLEQMLNPEKKLILVTGHRRENFGRGLEEVCNALLELGREENVEIIYPVHFNPNVSVPVNKILGNQDNIHLVSPVPYPTILWLMQRCDIIISDSGGIQEEAASFHKPVLVTRELTERGEGLEIGFSFIVGTSKKTIVSQAKKLINGPPDLSSLPNPYGDGKAAKRIVKIIQSVKLHV